MQDEDDLLGTLSDIRRLTYMVISLTVLSLTLAYSLFTEHPASLGVVSLLADLIIDMILISNYYGITALMTLESACIPVPSEVVMPFSGYLSLSSELSFPLVVISGTIGNLLGSLIAYLIGLHGGRPLIEKYGRYVLLSKEDLDRAETWFKRYGDVTILVSRMLPVIRTVISLPAGIGRMNLLKFSIYTLIGSIPWNLALTYLGLKLGENWIYIERLFDKLDLTFALAVLLLTIYLLAFRRDESGAKRFS